MIGRPLMLCTSVWHVHINYSCRCFYCAALNTVMGDNGTLWWARPLGTADSKLCVLSTHSSVRSVTALPHVNDVLLHFLNMTCHSVCIAAYPLKVADCPILDIHDRATSLLAVFIATVVTLLWEHFPLCSSLPGRWHEVCHYQFILLSIANKRDVLTL